MPILKPHQHEILRLICERGAVPRQALDGRNLRPLLAQELVSEAGEIVRPTPMGRALGADGERDGGPGEPAVLQPGRLSESQEQTLRYLLRQTGPVPSDHLDGRILRALQVRGLINSTAGWVSPTPTAATVLKGHTRREGTSRIRRVAGSAAGARSEAMLRALDELEHALPRDAELLVAGQPVYADDVVAGLRKLARSMGAGSRA